MSVPEHLLWDINKKLQSKCKNSNIYKNNTSRPFVHVFLSYYFSLCVKEGLSLQEMTAREAFLIVSTHEHVAKRIKSLLVMVDSCRLLKVEAELFGINFKILHDLLREKDKIKQELGSTWLLESVLESSDIVENLSNEWAEAQNIATPLEIIAEQMYSAIPSSIWIFLTWQVSADDKWRNEVEHNRIKHSEDKEKTEAMGGIA